MRILTAALCLVGSSPPAPAVAQVVEGRLLDSQSRDPIVLGKLALMDTTYTIVEETVSDHEGRFVLRAPAPGAYWILGERLGYHSVADGLLDLGEGGYMPVEFFMKARPIEIAGLTITGERQFARRKLEAGGFYRREEVGLGYFLNPEEIRERMPTSFNQLLRGIPGVEVMDSGSGVLVAFRSARMDGRGGRCSPRVYVDGVLQANMATTGTDMVNTGVAEVGLGAIEDIVAVEVYTRPSATPLQWGGIGACGVILLWTG